MRGASPGAFGKRVAAAGLLVAGAILCTFSAGDRLANIPGHATSRLTPNWFGPGDARQESVRAIDKQDFGTALHWAKIVINRDPIGQQSVSLLGLALLASGKPAAAQQAYIAAAATGWRDAGVQIYWMISALALGDDTVAAERLDALLRAGNRDTQTMDGLATLEQTPNGRKALGERLVLSPDWTTWYVRSLGDLHNQALQKRLAVLSDASARGLKMDPNIVASAATALRRHDETAAAAWLWVRFGGGGPDTGKKITNGRFEPMADDASPSPFDWTLLESGMVDVRIDANAPSHTGGALYTLSSATITQRVAQQSLILAPGPYRIHWNATDSQGARSSVMNVRVLCNDAPLVLTKDQPQLTGRTGYFAEFTVPDSGCKSQTVVIEARPQSIGSRAPAWLDNVSLVSRPLSSDEVDS
jgi:hypothetical protein